MADQSVSGEQLKVTDSSDLRITFCRFSKMNTWTPILLTILFAWNTNSQLFNNDIQTSSGPVRGTTVLSNGRTVTQYLGIPFAKPPVGQLRFKKPEPAERRRDVYVADKMPPACIQYYQFPVPWKDFQDGKSEDCLYLNIWVPRTLLPSKLSVMFWIYGGAYTIGSNRKRVYQGQALAGEGNVIVVTINYRLGALGFLTSDSNDAPGNAGLYDILEALKWVNRNIAAFGGDPQKVTLFGQSIGAITAGLFCVSPLSRGLFQRVIMESGAPTYLLAENKTANIALSQRLAKTVGCADDSTTIQSDPEAVVSCLRGVDAFTLAKTAKSFNPTSVTLFFPMYGDEILPTNPRQEIINMNFQNVDVLIGNNKDERSYQITADNVEVFGFFGEKDPKINKSYGEMMIRNLFRDFPDPEAVVRQYLGGLAEDDYDRVRYQVYTSTGDYILLCPTSYFAESYSRAGNNVYYYFFTHRPSTTPWAEWMGVVHFEEVQFVFGLPLQVPQNYTVQERYLSNKIIKTWTDFAKRGTTGGIAWPQYSRERPTYVVLDTGVRTRYGTGPHRDNCDFFRGYFGYE